MKKIPAILIFSTAILAFKYTAEIFTGAYTWPKVKPPIADINSYARVLHGDTVTDNYYWMIDYFKKGSDSTKVV